MLAATILAMSSFVWITITALILSLTAVTVFNGEYWRTVFLLTASLSVGLLLISAVATWLVPSPLDQGLTRVAVPEKWLIPDPVLGYRLSPGVTVLDTATYGSKTVYRVSYTIGADGNRVTPSAPPGADVYLFMGDSFVFGNALTDKDSLPTQFADATGFSVKAVNLGVPGYGPNHLVRAFEAGLLDQYTGSPVKAVVTWIIPAQLERVTGDAEWLSSSPHYAFTNGGPHFTGSFSAYRWSNPIAGTVYFGREHLTFLKPLGLQQRQEYQAELFVVLLVRLQKLVRERLGAPLVVFYSWPDETSGPNYSDSSVAQPFLVATLRHIRARDIPLISINRLISGLPLSQIMIPHDGHPTAHLNHLAAKELMEAFQRR